MANEEPNDLSIDTPPSPQSAKQAEEDEELRDSSTPPESTTATNTPQPGGGGFVNATQPETALDLQKFRRAGVKTFTQRCRLFVGNLPSSVTEDELKKLFVRYGEISEALVSPERGFGFIRLETRSLAEIAKAELDGTMLSNRPLRIRFATHGAALTVRNLSPSVSNELLEQAFLQFGAVERAVVIVDDQGRPTGNGIVEFSNKLSALKALDLCSSGAFLLTMSPRPVVVEPTEQFDEEDGLPEKLLQKSLPYYKERANVPRFAQPGTFDFEFSSRWKALEEIKKLHRDLIGRSIKVAKEKLEAEIEAAKNEHQLMMMRQDLMRRQEELRRLEELKNLELQKRKQLEMRHDGDKCRPDEDMMCHREQLDMKCNPDAFNSFLENRAQDMRMNPMNVRMNKTSSHEAGKMGDSLGPIQSYKMDVSGRGGHLKNADNTVQKDEFSDGRPKMAFHGHPDGDSLQHQHQHQHQHQQPSPRMVPACSASAALSPSIFTSASPAGDGFDASKNSWCGY